MPTQFDTKIWRNLYPQRAIKGAVLDCFADVLRGDVDLASGRVRPTGGLVLQISNGAGDFQDAIISAGAQIEIRHRHADEFLRIRGELTMFLQMTGSHAGIARHFRFVSESLVLDLAGALHALADWGGIFFSALARDIAILDSGHFDVEIDSVE